MDPVCAGESQAGNPIGSALVKYNLHCIFSVRKTDALSEKMAPATVLQIY